MEHSKSDRSQKPYDIRERLFLFACEVVGAVEFLQRRGPIARALSYQILDAGTSAGSNAHEAESASSRRDFIAKNRIALREAKETRFRLRVCRQRDYLDSSFEPLLQEADEIVRILGKMVHTALRNEAAQSSKRP
jgi:four helix bundle protein